MNKTGRVLDMSNLSGIKMNCFEIVLCLVSTMIERYHFLFPHEREIEITSNYCHINMSRAENELTKDRHIFKQNEDMKH